MEKFLNIRYTAMNAGYWGIYCALSGYAAVYLNANGFSAGQTGLLMALSNVLAALLQPVAAAKADKPGKIALKELILFIGIISMISTAVLCMVKGNFWTVSILFFLALVSSQILQPLINAVSMYYLNRGEKISFGLARGIGSLAYAGMSSLLGVMTIQWGAGVIPVLVLILYPVFLILAFSFKIKKPVEDTETEQEVPAD